MTSINTAGAVRAAINAEIRKKKEHFKKYNAKNKEKIQFKKRAFNAAKRARSFPFSTHGYYDPETGTKEINGIQFGSHRSKSV
jgi:hypothetical protein